MVESLYFNKQKALMNISCKNFICHGTLIYNVFFVPPTNKSFKVTYLRCIYHSKNFYRFVEHVITWPRKAYDMNWDVCLSFLIIFAVSQLIISWCYTAYILSTDILLWLLLEVIAKGTFFYKIKTKLLKYYPTRKYYFV